MYRINNFVNYEKSIIYVHDRCPTKSRMVQTAGSTYRMCYSTINSTMMYLVSYLHLVAGNIILIVRSCLVLDTVYAILCHAPSTSLPKEQLAVYVIEYAHLLTLILG